MFQKLRDLPDEYAKHWWGVGFRDGLIVAGVVFFVIVVIYFASKGRDEK